MVIESPTRNLESFNHPYSIALKAFSILDLEVARKSSEKLRFFF